MADYVLDTNEAIALIADGIALPTYEECEAAARGWLEKHDGEIAAEALSAAASSAIPRGALARETRSWLRSLAERARLGTSG